MEQDYPDEFYDYMSGLDENGMRELLNDIMPGVLASIAEEDDESPFGAKSQLEWEQKHKDFEEGYRKSRLNALAGKGGRLDADDIQELSRLAGKDESGFSPFDGDDEGVTDEMLEGYAKHLRNYLYTYKDEAQGIDPSIDPEEEHAGPMAQDIEKVAPDCVKETPEGVKTVDGNRLALVNAGVIGELSRRVLELEGKLNGKTI